jgi:hypothetical protein
MHPMEGSARPTCCFHASLFWGAHTVKQAGFGLMIFLGGGAPIARARQSASSTLAP